MVDLRTLRLVLPRPVRRLPADLSAVVVVVGATALTFLVPGAPGEVLRLVFGLPFALFLPGYAVVSALFPQRADAPRTDEAGGASVGSIDGVERALLSFWLSVVAVMFAGFGLSFLPWGVGPVSLLATLSATSVVAAGVAAIRRLSLPHDRRFRVPYRRYVGLLRDGLAGSGDGVDRALNVAVALSLVLAGGSVAYAMGSPNPSEQFSSLYLLTETDDGELVAADYPTELVRGEATPLVVGVHNRERERTNYTVVVRIQRVATENGSSRVVDQRELRRFRVTLGPDERWHRRHNVTPPLAGQRLRLQYLLFRGPAGPDPSAARAYRETHLWVNVTRPGGE